MDDGLELALGFHANNLTDCLSTFSKLTYLKNICFAGIDVILLVILTFFVYL
jgi:hypothetical protein